MDAKDYLKDYASKADSFLDSFFNKKIKEVKDIGKKGKGVSIAQDMLTRYKKFNHGGKKLRGALIQLGYEIAGGDKKEVLEASCSIEIIHSFLLIHDDIEDQDHIRRGNPTIHKQYEKKGTPHYGVSMGINVGDLGAYLGMEVLLRSKLPPLNKIKAATYLSRLLQRVAYGQGLDITYEQKSNITQKDIMQVHLHKTSIYTIGGPLKIGAILGGASDKVIETIEKFGEPIGIAFQLRDDELGLFSDKKILGKPIGGDIKEGKNTLLKTKAFELAKSEDKKFLKYAYGNRNISTKDIKRVQQITVNSGALRYSRQLSGKLLSQGKNYTTKITSDPKLQEILDNIAEFVVMRNS